MRTVRELEHVGVAAVLSRIRSSPKRAHSWSKIASTSSRRRDGGREIAYAVKARRDPEFRRDRTDRRGMQTHGYAEGVRRANLFAEAGADMVMIFPTSLEDAGIAWCLARHR